MVCPTFADYRGRPGNRPGSVDAVLGGHPQQGHSAINMSVFVEDPDVGVGHHGHPNLVGLAFGKREGDARGLPWLVCQVDDPFGYQAEQVIVWVVVVVPGL